MRRLIAIHIIFWLPVLASGQQTTNLDSLLKLLAYAKEDTNKISLLLNIGKEYFSANDFDSALHYNKEGEKHILKVDAPRCVTRPQKAAGCFSNILVFSNFCHLMHLAHHFNECMCQTGGVFGTIQSFTIKPVRNR